MPHLRSLTGPRAVYLMITGLGTAAGPGGFPGFASLHTGQGYSRKMQDLLFGTGEEWGVLLQSDFYFYFFFNGFLWVGGK